MGFNSGFKGLTAQLLSAVKTPNVTDGAAASQKVREAHPTAILARNCEYCALGQHLHQRHCIVEFALTETNLNLNGAQRTSPYRGVNTPSQLYKPVS